MIPELKSEFRLSRFKTTPAILSLVSAELPGADLRDFETVKTITRQESLRGMVEVLRQR